VNGALCYSPAINRRAARQASALVLYMSLRLYVKQLEKDEDIEFETVDLNRDRVVIETILLDPEKLAYDFVVELNFYKNYYKKY
jgi:hypothetical protein